jgi:predicted glycogen debranching enzyme
MNEEYQDRTLWSSLRDGPFPRVETFGELERAEAEWLHTNGAGAYAMSTVALMHTRRTHGILVAPMHPPVDRYVILSHADVELEIEGRNYRLWTHQFPNIAPTPGYRLLRRFVQDPVPTWVYGVGDGEFEMKLSLVRGHNALVLGYTWRGSGQARLLVRPLMPFRPIRSLMREHGAVQQHVHLRPGEVETQPVPHLPPLVFRYDGGFFVGSPDWWRRFEYADEQQAGNDFAEDLWTPGIFELGLEPWQTAHLVAAVGKLPDGSPRELQEQTIEFERAQDPGPSRPPAVRGLFVAAAHYCNDACDRPSITAGYPEYTVIARDNLVALPGLYLARGRHAEACGVLRTWIRYQCEGVMPTRLPRADGAPPDRVPEKPLPDATLLLLSAAHDLLQHVPAEDAFAREELYPALVAAFDAIRRGRAQGFWISADGLLANGDDRRPLTWMDAVIGEHLVTPRRGLAVEMQARWTRGTATLARLAREYGDSGMADAAHAACAAARAAFRDRFWCNETSFPFDRVSEARGTADAWVDATVRPNAVIALAEDASLFSAEQAQAIVDRARRELLTPRGLRSLAPHEEGYRGYYEGPPEERGSSYHQGTAWTHLLGYFVRAAARTAPGDAALREELQSRVEEALDNAPVLGHVAQLADGEQPHRTRGCSAQAWSAALLLRALVTDLGL